MTKRNNTKPDPIADSAKPKEKESTTLQPMRRMTTTSRARVLRAIRNYGWRMTPQQRQELVARLDEAMAHPIPLRRDSRFLRLARTAPAAAIFCIGHHDVMCFDGILTWDSTPTPPTT